MTPTRWPWRRRSASSADAHVLIGPYVLDALDDSERKTVERHLSECEVCAAEVAELRSAVARLGEDVAVAPPPGLRGRVLAAAARTPQVPPGPPPDIVPAVAPARRWRRLTAAAVAAGVLAIAAAAGAYIVQEQRVRQADDRVAAARAAGQAERTRIADTLAAGDATVRSARTPDGGRVVVVTSLRRDEAVAILTGVPAAPRDFTYQLWLIADDRARSAGVLSPTRRDGTYLMRGLAGAEQLGVTVEPVGGSPAPTTPPIVLLRLR